MQVGCEVDSEQHDTVTQKTLPHILHKFTTIIFCFCFVVFLMDRRTDRALQVKGQVSQHLLPPPLTICLAGSPLPLLRLNSKLAVS